MNKITLVTAFFDIKREEFGKFARSNDKYFNESYSIHAPIKSTVIKYDESSILLKCDNSYYAYFDNLVNVNVTYLDVVEPKYSLANFIDQFTFYFYKDNVKYSYEEVMESN